MSGTPLRPVVLFLSLALLCPSGDGDDAQISTAPVLSLARTCLSGGRCYHLMLRVCCSGKRCASDTSPAVAAFAVGAFLDIGLLLSCLLQ